MSRPSWEWEFRFKDGVPIADRRFEGAVLRKLREKVFRG